MKKKLFTAILVSALAVSCIAGCGKTADTATTTATEAPVVTEAPAATEAPVVTEAPAATEAPVATEAPAVTEAPVATEAPAVTEAPAATEAVADYAGTYTDASDGSTLAINADGTVELSLVRLTVQSGKVEAIENGTLSLLMEDAAGNDMKATFVPGTGLFTVTDSTWEYLKNGDTFTFTK